MEALLLRQARRPERGPDLDEDAPLPLGRPSQILSAAWAPAADAQQAAQLDLSARLSAPAAPCPM